jgi:hypothetical protein
MVAAFQLNAFQLDAFQAFFVEHGLIWARSSVVINTQAEVVAMVSSTVVVENPTEVEAMPQTFFGSRVNIEVTFRDIDKVEFDPAVVRFMLIRPDTTTLTLTHPHADIENPNVGIYFYSLLLNQVGEYRWRWESTAVDEESAQEGRFTVPPRLV